MDIHFTDSELLDLSEHSLEDDIGTHKKDTPLASNEEKSSTKTQDTLTMTSLQMSCQEKNGTQAQDDKQRQTLKNLITSWTNSMIN